MRYAEGTAVSVEASRAEISSILTKHGVRRQSWGSDADHGDMLQFELGGYTFRFQITYPTLKEVQKMYPNARDYAPKVAQEWKRRWRANVLLLKAKLEFADGETTTVMRELMPYTVLSDGRTLEEAIAADGLPLLTAGK